ncbi:MAG: LysR family transcriptional regulator [Proteobacteria bacterium]|nr:MAG: LysR family transcriptional regulator [Pseudomonadota bacterium]
MEMEEVSVFVKVVELGSLTAAGKILGMPKTTVSAKLTKLERRLGVTLIQRTTRRLHVTDEGRIYYKHCAAALGELLKAEASLQARRERPQGVLKITAPIDVGHSLLPKIISQYLEKFPGTEVSMIVTNRVVDLVGEGIDLAIRVGHMKDSNLMTRKFFDVDFVFCATQRYLDKHGKPDLPKDLTDHEVIMYPGDRMRLTRITDGKVSTRITPKNRLSTDEMGTIKALAILHLGIGWLPLFLVESEIRANSLVAVLNEWRLEDKSHYAFVYPEHKYQTPNVREFIALAMGHTKGQVGG